MLTRTPKDEITQLIIKHLSNAYEDDTLSEVEWLNEHRHNAETITKEIWEYLEPYALDNKSFDYGIVKIALKGYE